MNLTNQNEIQALLGRHGFRFSKAMGQNFLIADWVPRQIAEAAGVDEQTGVLEIGPGLGCLTAALSDRAGKVLAVELDKSLRPVLEETLAGRENVELLFGDASPSGKLPVTFYKNEQLAAMPAFTDYSLYFSMNTDLEAVNYLQLANELIHEVDPNAISVAEDMSGMPGMCLPIEEGGIGFDYRLAMGEPDYWIKLLKDTRDEDWQMHGLWYEMTTRRPQEKVIGYCESHDQALVGDKTIIFRMADAEMYTGMNKEYHSITMDRAIELHKMIRFMTMTLGGNGYLNFMGNEFGHPEWIDFPREGNGWSYKYCRRQWSLVDNKALKYEWLNDFDAAMISLAREKRILDDPNATSLWIDQDRKIITYSRGRLLFLFNFHSSYSERDFFLHAHTVGEGSYKVILSTDELRFGGQGIVAHDYVYHTGYQEGRGLGFQIYSPARTAMVLERIGD